MRDCKVTIVVRAYNVEQTIRQALDSILAQRTVYPYEIILGENCSSDGTLTICREYADKYENITLLAHEKNLGGVGNWIRCVKQGTGKYIMICDGDDYWHNPEKIQIEVDYMEAHPECVLLHTDINRLNNQTGKIRQDYYKTNGIVQPEGRVQYEVFTGKVSIANVTSCYRRTVFEQHVPTDKFLELGLLGDDYPTWVILAAYGDVRYIPISTATYRTGQQSLTHEVNYDQIRLRYETEHRQVEWLRSMFPALGTSQEQDIYDRRCSHQLLMAAYWGNDYCSARKFAKKDQMPDWKTMMAHTWFTFQIARLYLLGK